MACPNQPHSIAIRNIHKELTGEDMRPSAWHDHDAETAEPLGEGDGLAAAIKMCTDAGVEDPETDPRTADFIAKIESGEISITPKRAWAMRNAATLRDGLPVSDLTAARAALAAQNEQLEAYRRPPLDTGTNIDNFTTNDDGEYVSGSSVSYQRNAESAAMEQVRTLAVTSTDPEVLREIMANTDDKVTKRMVRLNAAYDGPGANDMDLSHVGFSAKPTDDLRDQLAVRDQLAAELGVDVPPTLYSGDNGTVALISDNAVFLQAADHDGIRTVTLTRSATEEAGWNRTGWDVTFHRDDSSKTGSESYTVSRREQIVTSLGETFTPDMTGQEAAKRFYQSVANELPYTGKSLSEYTNMSHNDLLRIEEAFQFVEIESFAGRDDWS